MLLEMVDQFGSGAGDELFEQLGQLAGDDDLPFRRNQRLQIFERSQQPAGRLQQHDRLVAGCNTAQLPAAGAAAARQKAGKTEMVGG